MLQRLSFIAAAMVLGLTAPAAMADAISDGTSKGEWPTYGGDLANRRYAPLDQINAANFGSLKVAWRFRADSLGPRPETNFQSTPLMVGGVVYTTAGSRRAVVALDAVTGEMLWMHSLNEGARGAAAPRRLSGRGLAYWSDGDDRRIIYVTPGYRMLALDARTGRPVPGFGVDGVVDLKQGLDQTIDPETADIGLHAAPVIAQGVIIVGAAHMTGSVPKVRNNVKGYVRGFDVRTGKRLWIFHTIPLPGEPGSESWLDGSAATTGNTGLWTQVSVDEDLGLAYLPTESPTGDYYGGHRPGNGLFGESLVAVDLHTGKVRWSYQLVHHGVWDWDNCCAPVLADIVVGGKPIKAAALPTKQAWLYVFDRVTGKPVWPIVERRVEASRVPLERSSPTQPFVTRPPAFDRQGVTIDDLIDFTPELRAKAEAVVANYRIGPLFTPPVESRWPRPLATLQMPSAVGGANWMGGSLDPDSHRLFIYSATMPSPIGLIPADPRTSDMAYVEGRARDPAAPAPTERPAGGAAANQLTVEGLPLVKPPYGRITAIDLDRGDIAWQIAHGETADEVRNHPLLKGLSIPRTGRVGRVGVLTTKTVLIAGDGGVSTQADGRKGAMLRAYDKGDGHELGAVYMPAPPTGSPMTYMADGKQYVVVAISAPGFGSELVAYTLP